MSRPDAVGRYWGSATRATLHEHHEGDATIHLDWEDGAHLTFYEHTHENARATLARLGFAEPKSLEPSE